MNLDKLQLLVQARVDDILIDGVHDQILQLANVCNLEVCQQVVIWQRLIETTKKDSIVRC